jgi:hypothetical protein
VADGAMLASGMERPAPTVCRWEGEVTMQVPPASHPAWADLLNGKSAHQPAFLAARMLIVRCRMELVREKDSPTSLAKFAGELRELYAKNATTTSANQDLTALFG